MKEYSNNKRRRRQMTCKYNYRSICLRNKTHSKLENLSNIVDKGEKLSIPKTVEKLIDWVDNSESKTEGIINAKSQNQQEV